MSLFVDTGVYYALQNQRANRHAAAETALDAVSGGRFGSAFTSDYVFDEAVTLVRSRTGRYDEAMSVADRILGRNGFPQVLDLLHVDEGVFDRAVEVFDRYDDQPLSFTDATTVALVERRGIDAVLSFDDDFDGLVDRIDPGELAS